MKGTVYGAGVEVFDGMRQNYQRICYQKQTHIFIIQTQDGVGKRWFLSDCDSTCEQFICEIPEEVRPELERHIEKRAAENRGTRFLGHHKRVNR